MCFCLLARVRMSDPRVAGRRRALRARVRAQGNVISRGDVSGAGWMLDGGAMLFLETLAEAGVLREEWKHAVERRESFSAAGVLAVRRGPLLEDGGC